MVSRASWARPLGCRAGEFELYPKVMGTEEEFKQESE